MYATLGVSIPSRAFGILTLILALVTLFPFENSFGQTTAADVQAAIKSKRRPPDSDHEQIVAYWTSETAWKSELQLRNNLIGQDLTVTPALRLPNGAETALAAVTIKPQEVKSIDLDAAIGAAAAPQLMGTWGSVVLRYHSVANSNLYAALMIRNIGHPFAFHIDATGESEEYLSGGREGVWWLPTETTNDYLIVTNQGDNTIPATLSLYAANGVESKQNLLLGPHEATRYSVRKLLQAAKLSGSYGGIQISTPSHAGSLDTLHFIYDEKAAFSAILKMFDHNPNSKVEERDFAKTGAWTLRAPMLALSNPDPALAFPPGTTLHPQIFVRNTTAKMVDASIRFGSKAATNLRLNPNETRGIDVSAFEGAVIPKQSNWTSVAITTKGLPDEIVAVAASYDTTLRYGAQTPFSDQLSFQWEGGMWEYDPYHSSIITAGNGGKKPTQVAFTIFYNQGTQKYELEQTLQPDEQMWVDVGKLIREHASDKNGKTLPLDLTMGSYEIRDLTSSHVGSLFEGKIIYDKTYGHAAYGCARCCGYPYAPVLTFDPLGIPFQSSSPNNVSALNSCTNYFDDVSDSFYGNWSTVDTSIATVDYYATHSGVAVGSTTSNTFGSIPTVLRYTCPLTQRNPHGGDNVLKLSLTPSPLNMSTGDTNVTIGLSISPSNISVQPAFTASLSSNPNSSSQAGVTITNPSSPVSGSYNAPISASGANSPSGLFNVLAAANGVSSNVADLQIPPQILIQMIQAEAGGTNVTTMTAVGEVVRNRFGSSLFNPPYSTYQNAIPGQFATTSTANGIEPELDIASSVFAGVSAGNFCGSLAFWTPTLSQWQTVQTAMQSGTTAFPANTGAPTYNQSVWPTSQQQILYVSAIGQQASGPNAGAPNFLFLTQRSSTQPAAITASCN